MNGPAAGTRADRVRALIAGIAERLGGVPAVRTVGAVLATYDRAGGGLVAGGLAYAALVAILPGLLLLAGVVGLLITDPALRRSLLDAIANAVPPLEEFARLALDQAAVGAAPSSIVALVGIVFGASRFYAALDAAFARIFDNDPVRHILIRYVRALIGTLLIVIVPVSALVVGAVVVSLVRLDIVADGTAPMVELWVGVGSPLVTVALFVVGAAGVFRLVPARQVPLGVLGRPAVVSGVVIGLFTQLFALVAPLLLGTAAFYGAFVAVFALLVWLSVSLNVLLLGASWTRVRLLAAMDPDATSAVDH